MKTLTALEFLEQTAKNPAWATTITEPTEIVGVVNFTNHPIAALSPLLYFKYPAQFLDCEQLKLAEGVFLQGCSFEGSGITAIGELTAHTNPETNDAANFGRCERLETASGTYYGEADFSRSRVKKIENLNVSLEKPGRAATFTECPDILVATGTYPGYVSFYGSGVQTIENFQITGADADGWAANLSRCDHLKTATGTYNGFAHFAGCRTLHQIKDLEITGKTTKTAEGISPGNLTSFISCHELKSGPNWLLKNCLIENELRATISKQAAKLSLRKDEGITI